MFLVRLGSNVLPHELQDLGKIDGLPFDLEPPGLQPRQVEQLSDQGQHPQAALLDVPQIFPLLGGQH